MASRRPDPVQRGAQPSDPAALLQSLKESSLRPRRLLESDCEHLRVLEEIANVQRMLHALKRRLVLEQVDRCIAGSSTVRDRGRVGELLAVLAHAVRR